ISAIVKPFTHRPESVTYRLWIPHTGAFARTPPSSPSDGARSSVPSHARAGGAAALAAAGLVRVASADGGVDGDGELLRGAVCPAAVLPGSAPRPARRHV